jgi:hypothetical protein
MTAKEKANELGNKFYNGSVFDYSKEEHLIEVKRAKKCAIICVNELLDTVPYINNTQSEVKKRIYYMDVRTEINNL